MAKLPSSHTKAGAAASLGILAVTAGFTGLVSLVAQGFAVLAALAFIGIIASHRDEWRTWLDQHRREGRLKLLIALIVTAGIFLVLFTLYMRPAAQAALDSIAPENAAAERPLDNGKKAAPERDSTSRLPAPEEPPAETRARQQAPTPTPVPESHDPPSSRAAPAPVLGLEETRAAIRELLNSVDARIVPRIDDGHLTMRTRITERQYRRLLELKQTPAGERLVLDATVIGTHRDSVINNGTLGPTTAEALQYSINLVVSADLRQ